MGEMDIKINKEFFAFQDIKLIILIITEKHELKQKEVFRKWKVYVENTT